MGWVEDLRGKVIGLDTAPLIYYIERNPLYVDILRPFFQAVDRGEISIVTSVITLTETLVHPLRNGNKDLADRYRDILLRTKGLVTYRSLQILRRRLRNCVLCITFVRQMLCKWQLLLRPQHHAFSQMMLVCRLHQDCKF